MHKDLILVHIKWSKTRQYVQDKLMVPVIRVLDDRICPLKWFGRMLKLSSGAPRDPAFMVPGHDKCWKPLTYRQFSAQIKEWIKLVGLEPKKYTTHCLCRGGASWAFQVNLPGKAVWLLGDWASESYLKYINVTLEA